MPIKSNLIVTSIYVLLMSKSTVFSHDISTLKLLQIVHRHGDRTPISFYPNDPYQALSHWPEGLGELTARGKERMYRIGLELLDIYQHYLGDSPKSVYVRSSASNRCLESASALVSALYAPKNEWIWSKDLKLATSWQPIAVQTVERAADGLLVPESDCPAADNDYNQLMKGEEVRQFMDSRRGFIVKVENKTGEKYERLRQLEYLSNTIRNEIDYGLNEPQWLSQIGNDTLDRLFEFEKFSFRINWSTKLIQRLRAGLLLRELINNMVSATDSAKQGSIKKLYSYSTHDTLIVTLLQALDIYSGEPPVYGFALLFELHEIGSQFAVRLFAVKTKSLTNFELDIRQILGSCGANQTVCEVSRFKEMTAELIPVDWHQECQLSSNKDNSSSKEISSMTKFWWSAIGFGVGIVLMILIIIIVMFVKKSKKRDHYFDNSNSVNSEYIRKANK